MKKYTVGVDVGGTKMAFGLFDHKRRLLGTLRRPTNPEHTSEDFAQALVEGLGALLQEHGLAIGDLDGVGIGMPSFIDFEEGEILLTSNMTKVKNFRARDYFEKHLGVRVLLDNDTHVAAIAEHKYGAGQGKRHMVFCIVGTGLASSFIINNELFRGSYGAAGETGHMIITPGEGVLCGCENHGCFMSHISGSMIKKHIIAQIDCGRSTVMPELAGGDKNNICGEHMLQAYQMEDPLAVWAFHHMSDYLGIWLYNLYQAMNIDTFVFGGGLTKCGSVLFDRAFQVFYTYNKGINRKVDFRFAQLGDITGIIGARELLG